MNHRGFTLIETLIYLGLFAILMSGILVSAYGLFESAAHNEARALVAEEGEFLTAKMDYMLGGVKSIDLPSVGAAGGESVKVTRGDGAVLTATLAGGMLASTTGAAFNNTNVMVADVPGTPFAIHTAASSDGITPEGISVAFRLYSTTTDGFLIYQDFSSVKYLRK